MDELLPVGVKPSELALCDHAEDWTLETSDLLAEIELKVLEVFQKPMFDEKTEGLATVGAVKLIEGV